MGTTLPTDDEREPRTVLARPDDAVIIVRHDPTSRGGLALTVDHVPGSDPVPVIVVGDVADFEIAAVLHGWLYSHTVAGSRGGGQ